MLNSQRLHVPRRMATTPMAMAVTAVCLLGMTPGVALAQTAPGQPAEAERVIITGSSIKRVDAETALPVTVITREEIDKTGAATAADLLRRLPQSGSGSVTQGATRAGPTPGGENIALRDLSPNATLVLLNGRRLPNYPLSSVASTFVSLDQIPIGALERIEVLKDGASAIYGSDAVAGVVNFITRSNYEGIETSFRYGDAQRGKPREIAVSISGGFGNFERDGYNALLTLDHLDRTRLNQSDRSYTSSSDNRARGGADRRLFYSLPSNAQSLTTGALLVPATCPASAVKDGLCYTDYTLFNTIVPASTRTNLTGIFTLRLNPQIVAFGELLASQQESRTTSSPDILVGSYTTLGTARGNPFREDLVAFGLIPGTPLRDEIVKSNSVRALAGVRGTRGNIDWEAALSHGRGRTTSSFTGQLVAAATEAALLNGDVSPFGIVANSPERIASILGSNDRKSTVTTTEADARVNMPVFTLPAGSVELSAGASYRAESLDDKTDPKVSTLANGIDYGRRDSKRSVTAVYAEVLVPVLPSLEAQLSARHDRYNDFGGSTNPKVSLRWKALPDLSFRASAASGFRAPTLAQLVDGATGGFAPGVIDPRRCPVTRSPLDCGGGSVPLEVGGNKDLKPQTSRSWSAGFVFQLGRNVELTLDHYNIDYRNQIDASDVDTLLRNELAGTGNLIVRRAATPADIAAGIPGAIQLIRNVPANLARSKVAGWDAEVKTRFNAADVGRFVWTVAGTYVDKLEAQRDPTGPFTNIVGSFAQPRARVVSALDWARGDWSARLGARYTGGFRDGAASSFPGVGTLKVNGYTQLDAQLGLRPLPSTTVTLGVTNLADKRSPYSNATFTGNAPNGDLIGRAYYVAVRHAWR